MKRRLGGETPSPTHFTPSTTSSGFATSPRGANHTQIDTLTERDTATHPRTTHRYQAAKENPSGPRAPLKVVYVVLESQYQSSMSAAVKAINENENSGVACECVGYLLEELRDPANAEAFKKDVEEANVFIGSLIFVQELAEQVKAVVEAERDRLDAVLIFPSMPEVMRLNKVGGFTMASLGQSKSVVSEFMKKKKADDGSSFEEAMLKLLRTLPKVLKYLPGDKAKDAKSFMMSFQYWLGGSPENLQSMLLSLATTYVPGRRREGRHGVPRPGGPHRRARLPARQGHLAPARPRGLPDGGGLLPVVRDGARPCCRFGGRCSRCRSCAAEVHINTGDAGHYVSLISELEARGAKVVCIYSGGLDFSAR